MGCAASTASPTYTAARHTGAGSSKAESAADPQRNPLRSRGSSDSLSSDSSESSASVVPFYEYYTLASLCGRELFGPFLKLRNYEPETGRLQLSVLVVGTEAVQQRCNGQLNLSWWELPSTEPGLVAPGLGSTGVEVEGVAESFEPGADAMYTCRDDVSAGHCHGAPANGGGDGSRSCQLRGQHTPPTPTPTPTPLQQQQEVVKPEVPLDGETVPGELLFSWRNWRFWRFRFSPTCGLAPKRLVYQVGLLPGRSHSIAVPAVNEPWRLAFFSCNGLDASNNYPFEDKVAATRALALWRDVARRHKARPIHLLLGGGDQLYNDAVFEGPNLKGWDRAKDDKDTAVKAAIPFSDEIAREVEEFYFSHYAAHWSQPAYADMFATVPTFNSWDDHDIIDGWGSYHGVINDSAIMQGVFRVAQLFYLLFQHHTTLDRLTADGYWCEPASCALLRLGASVALLVPDTRTCRSQDQILPPSFLQQVQTRISALPPSVQHVIVLLGGPVIYPQLPVQDVLQKLDDLFTGDTLLSVVMQKTGLAAKVTKRFGMVEYLDDIIDQWSAQQHRNERDQLLETMIALSEERGIRITLLSGDVHCAGYGMLHRRGNTPEGAVEYMPVPSEDARAADPRFIPQIISSAIVNEPPPVPLMKWLCLSGRKPRAILKDCVQRMVPLFGHEEDINSLLLGRRNWCEATLGGPEGHLAFSWRCEKELGSEQVNVFSVTVPPLIGSSS